jgi:hypothetical protein
MPTPSVLIVPNRLKAGILYSQLPANGDVDFSVTRATTAYRTNASGILESVASGVPRLDYPIGGGCPSLLVEPAATNLVLRSEEFNTTWTAVAASVTANAATAPNGTLSADKLIDNATLTNHRVQQTTTSAAGSNTFSVFAKKSEVEFVALRIGSDIGYFNLNNGTFGGLSAGITARTIDAGNGWYRCIITKAAAIANENVLINTADAIGSIFYAGTSGGIFLWGAQYEVGSVATSYIPTVAATATRNADVISKTGVSGFIGQAEGTLYIDFNYNQAPNDANGRLLQVQAGLVNETNGIFPFILNNNQFQLSVFVGGGLSQPVPASAATIVPFGQNKFAIAYNAGSYTVYRNGSLFASGTGGSPSSLSAIMLGTSFIAQRSINNRIRAAAIYPTRLSNAELAALTTL